MYNRRQFALLAAAAGSALVAGDSLLCTDNASVAGTWSPPKGACDTHVHVVGDPVAFPMSPSRGYTPPLATADDLLKLQKQLKLDRVVVVTASLYGTNNAATVDAVKTLGRARARGIAVVDAKITREQIDALSAAGIVGHRIILLGADSSVSLGTQGDSDTQKMSATLDAGIKIAQQKNWHVQVYSRPQFVAKIADVIRKSPVPIVFDHFCGAITAKGLAQEGFSAVLDLVAAGKCYVKISGDYRASAMAPNYDDVAPFVQALVKANPNRILWGTDWPHVDSSAVPGRKPTDLAPNLTMSDTAILGRFAKWVPDEKTRRKILVDNPARVYGF